MNRKIKVMRVHQIVMLAFIGKSNLCINHKNGIKTDNRLENLEYCTNSENIRHAFRTGIVKFKLELKDVIKIRELYKTGNYYQREIAEMYNVHQVYIGQIIANKVWK